MIFRVAPSICSAFKGVLPSDLVHKYAEQDGYSRMMLDLMVASEIQDQVAEASDKAQKKGNKPKPADAKGMVARMKQRREKRLKENDS